ncbi:MAG: hypothetical protein QG599_133 [Pseudomonadota bacterium]|nr:hypothetical protein [Pseudomonadota bacterium]
MKLRTFASETPQPWAIEAPTPLAPRPRTLAETGLDRHFLAELVVKHLHAGGVLTLSQLSERLTLAGSILETILDFLRKEARIEVLGSASGGAELRYALTDRGRIAALEGLLRSGYIGPAPVTLNAYTEVVRAQSVHHKVVTQADMRQAFHGVLIRDSLLDQFGPALHSGRAIFVYGQPGTGKTYLSQRLSRLLGDAVLIPYAIQIDGVVVQIFDPVLHQPVANARQPASPNLCNGHDPRYVLCQRPSVLTGGELTLDMLELQYDADHKLYRAPLQLKATNGLYLIDDLGRQRVAPVDLLNRWIVPMDTNVDYLTLSSGQRFSVLFDVVLVFSTNLNPLDLADEAFLRRLGYKIRFDPLEPDEYERLWRLVCQQMGIVFDADLLHYLLECFYARDQVPLLPCHPRDLLGLIRDHCRYHGQEVEQVTLENLAFAWSSYFIYPI